MTEKKQTAAKPTIAKDNRMPATEKKNFTPVTGHGVQGNHVPETGTKPSTPAPAPKKK